MLRRQLKQVFYSVWSMAAAESRIKRLHDQNLAAVLNLHRVSPVPSQYWPPLTPDVFEELLQFLQAKFHLCDIKELTSTRSEKPVAVLSFDDGYYDFLEYALPLLDRYSVPANMNIIPQCALTGKPIWNVRLYDFLQSASVDQINELDIPGFSERLNGGDSRAKVRFGVAVSRYLKNRPKRDREEILRAVEPVIDSVKDSNTRMMTTEEIRQISGRVSIGAHSFS